MSARTLCWPLALLVSICCLAPVLAGSPFKVPEPKLIYKGTGPGLPAGVVVIRKAGAYEDAITPLAPGVEAGLADPKESTILRVVGRTRENSCRQTKLEEVSTNFITATVRLQEFVPAQGCDCPQVATPPRVWLIEVGRVVRRAKIQVTDVVVSCDEATTSSGGDQLTTIYQGSWDKDPGSEIISDAETYKNAMNLLGLADRGPSVDFSSHSVVIVTGRPRSNGCRKTAVVGATLTNAEEVLFTIEEVYPAQGQICTQIFLTPKMFIYRVPRSVIRARSVTKEIRQ